jgi:heme O synthase-like polyprenyltransferase
MYIIHLWIHIDIHFYHIALNYKNEYELILIIAFLNVWSGV